MKPQYVKISGDPDDYPVNTEVEIPGQALLDFGENMYVYGTQSRSAANPNSNAYGCCRLNRKFDNVSALAWRSSTTAWRRS